MYTGRAAATINRPVPFLALNSASVLLLIASFAVSRAAYDCGGSKRGGPTLFSRDHGVSSEEASGIVIFQCGNSTPAALTAVNTSAFATASSIPIADLSVLINAACESPRSCTMTRRARAAIVATMSITFRERVCMVSQTCYLPAAGVVLVVPRL